jgi:hypothetical protein
MKKRSAKRALARQKHLVNKVRDRVKYICALAAMTRDEEDYFSTILSRLNTYAVKHLANGVIVAEAVPDWISMQLKEAAANELIQRKIFGKKITPFHRRELLRFNRRAIRRLLRD